MESVGIRTAAASWRSPFLSRQTEPTGGLLPAPPPPFSHPTAAPAPECNNECRKVCTAALQATEPILSPELSTVWTLVCVCVCVQMHAQVCWMHPKLRTGTCTPPSPPSPSSAPFPRGFTCTLELAAPPALGTLGWGFCWGIADSTLEIKVPMGSGRVPALLGVPRMRARAACGSQGAQSRRRCCLWA